MQKILLSILLLVLLSSCDDILWTDGPTKVKGYVIDKTTNQKIANAKVYVSTCGGTWAGKYCSDLLDSTFTNAQGYYEINFKDKRKTDFGVRVATYPDNDFVYLPLIENLTQTNDYRIVEGETNVFDFYVLSFRVLEVKLRLQNTGYKDLTISPNSVNDIVFLPDRANNIDTTFYFKGIPLYTNYIDLKLEAQGKSHMYISKMVYMDVSDTTKFEIIQ